MKNHDETYYYHVYMTLDNGEGMTERIFIGEEITDFTMFTSMFAPGCKLTIEYLKGM
jgi:hypothetical protein